MKKRKIKSKKRICSEVSAKQSRESVESVLEKKRKAIRWEGFAEKKV